MKTASSVWAVNQRPPTALCAGIAWLDIPGRSRSVACNFYPFSVDSLHQTTTDRENPAPAADCFTNGTETVRHSACAGIGRALTSDYRSRSFAGKPAASSIRVSPFRCDRHKRLPRGIRSPLASGRSDENHALPIAPRIGVNLLPGAGR
jgi:hypothetical protein